MKSLNIVQMENGVLFQIAKQPNQIIKSLVFEGEGHIERLLEKVQQELAEVDATTLTVASN